MAGLSGRRRGARQHLWLRGLVVCCIGTACHAWANLPAAEPAVAEDLLSAQLDSGEFAPALALAEKAAEPDQRDRWLAMIAGAQARAGARGASFSTVAGIGDDRIRAATLDEVAAEPAGANGRGGGVQPDFDALIDLITSTIAPDSWDEAGGPGAIQEFAGGVYVDALGVMRPVVQEEGTDRLANLRRFARRGAADDVRRTSHLRKVSLPRLEREVQLRLAAGEPLDEAMIVLAGLQRVQYIFVYPESGDLVLAGPAGDWKIDRENRVVGAETGRPVLRLDDLVVLLRHITSSRDGKFGCSIMPTEDGLAKARAFQQQSSGRPLAPGGRTKWLEQLRRELGQQTVEVYGLDPRTRVAHVLVEADYRMKLVGIGLEEGTLDVPSYLAMIEVPAGEAPRPLGVVRWWFTMNYDALLGDADRAVFELVGQGVRVQSENELLTASGKRIHTGQSDLESQEFAHRFTQHFPALAAKYPVYAELQNVFDLALVAALIEAEGLADRVGWHMTSLADPERFAVASGPLPRAVDTVVNHRLVRKTQVLAAVSGGVVADPRQAIQAKGVQVDRKGRLGSERLRSAPDSVGRAAWWWD